MYRPVRMINSLTKQKQQASHNCWRPRWNRESEASGAVKWSQEPRFTAEEGRTSIWKTREQERENNSPLPSKFFSSAPTSPWPYSIIIQRINEEFVDFRLLETEERRRRASIQNQLGGYSTPTETHTERNFPNQPFITTPRISVQVIKLRNLTVNGKIIPMA